MRTGKQFAPRREMLQKQKALSIMNDYICRESSRKNLRKWLEKAPSHRLTATERGSEWMASTAAKCSEHSQSARNGLVLDQDQARQHAKHTEIGSVAFYDNVHILCGQLNRLLLVA